MNPPQGLLVDSAGAVTIHRFADLDGIAEWAESTVLPPRLAGELAAALNRERTAREAERAERDRAAAERADQFWGPRQDAGIGELETTLERLGRSLAAVRNPGEFRLHPRDAVQVYDHLSVWLPEFLGEVDARVQSIQRLGLTPKMRDRLVDRLIPLRRRVVDAQHSLDGLGERVAGYAAQADRMDRADRAERERLAGLFPALQGQRPQPPGGAQ